MKLIIDIPEEIVTAIQNGEDYRYDLHTTIAQGIPYEPKGDLINREDLKKEIAEFHQKEKERLHNSLWESIGLNALNKLIDNAPTVTPLLNLDNITEEDIKKFKIIGQRATSKGLFPTIEDRWQVEWINESQETSFYKIESFKCSGCGWKVSERSRFCPNCGAKMREGDLSGK